MQSLFVEVVAVGQISHGIGALPKDAKNIKE